MAVCICCPTLLSFPWHDWVPESQRSRLSDLRETAAGNQGTQPTSESPQSCRSVPKHSGSRLHGHDDCEESLLAVSQCANGTPVGLSQALSMLGRRLSTKGCVVSLPQLPEPMWARTLSYPTQSACPTCLPLKIKMQIKTPTCPVTLTKRCHRTSTICRSKIEVCHSNEKKQNSSRETVGSRVSSTERMSGAATTR